MTYYVGILVQDNAWTETMGDTDKEAVDFEVQCWKDSNRGSKFKVFRKAFPRVATQKQLTEWVATLVARNFA